MNNLYYETFPIYNSTRLYVGCTFDLCQQNYYYSGTEGLTATCAATFGLPNILKYEQIT